MPTSPDSTVVIQATPEIKVRIDVPRVAVAVGNARPQVVAVMNNLGMRGIPGPPGADGADGAPGVQGFDGAPGEDGQDGQDGAAGATGAQGIQGVPGDPGADGADGLPGEPGEPGVQGIPGDDGADGATGAQGIQGIPGTPGADGADGTDGDDGPQGIQGIPGIQGDPGADGADGSTGATGAPGIQGVPGVDGEDGADGDQGIQGVPGSDGEDGAVGAQGVQGEPGNDGEDGATGATGATGAAGAQGIQGTTGAAGSAGAQGIQGVPGVDGDDGATGATGAAGAQGATGAAGAQGATGAAGAAGAAGAQGIQGIQGVEGPTGQVSVAALELAATQSLPLSTFTKANLTVAPWPVVGADITIDTTNKRMTAVVAGYYHVSGFVAVQKNSTPSLGDVEAQIRINGSNTNLAPAGLGQTVGGDGANVGASFSGIVKLAAGDYIELWVKQATSDATAQNLLGTTADQYRCRMQMVRLVAGATGPTGPAGTGTPILVTALTAGLQGIPNPITDGFLVVYSPAAGVLWNLRYNLAAAKWDFTGGSDLIIVVPDGSLNPGANTPSSINGASNLFTAPFAGDYDIYHQGVVSIGVNGLISTGISVNGGAPTFVVRKNMLTPNTDTFTGYQKVTLAAAGTAELKWNTSSSSFLTRTLTSLKVRPIRIG